MIKNNEHYQYKDILNIEESNIPIIYNNIKDLFNEKEANLSFDSMTKYSYNRNYNITSNTYKNIINNSDVSKKLKNTLDKMFTFEYSFILDVILYRILEDAFKDDRYAIGFIENNLLVPYIDEFYITEDGTIVYESLKLLDGNYKDNFILKDNRDTLYDWDSENSEIIEIKRGIADYNYNWEEQEEFNSKVIHHFFKSLHEISKNNKNYLVLLIQLLKELKRNLVHHLYKDEDKRDINKAIHLIKANILNKDDDRWVDFVSVKIRGWWD